jgi:non-specific riboncleoside hydrolase
MTAGTTIVDLKGYLGKPNNAKVCLDIDQQLFREWLLDSLRKCN